jgi:hypothetical protein
MVELKAFVSKNKYYVHDNFYGLYLWHFTNEKVGAKLIIK